MIDQGGLKQSKSQMEGINGKNISISARYIPRIKVGDIVEH